MAALFASINPNRDNDFREVLDKIGNQKDDLQNDLRHRKVLAPYYAEPIIAQGPGSPSLGAMQQQYIIPRGTGLYCCFNDTLSTNLGGVTLSGAAANARYCDGYGLAHIKDITFRVGQVNLCYMTKFSLYMYYQLQQRDWRNEYLNQTKFGGTHDAAELAAPQEINIALPGPFEPLNNTLRTNKLESQIQYAINYSTPNEIIFPNAVGVTVTSAPINKSQLTTLNVVGDHQDPIFLSMMANPEQRLNVTTYMTQDITISTGASRFMHSVRWGGRIEKILFYISNKAPVDVGGGVMVMDYFTGIKIKQFRFKLDGQDFPSTGFQTAGYNRLQLADMFGVTFDTNIYGLNIGYSVHDYKASKINTALLDGNNIKQLDLEIEFDAPLASDHEIHVYYELDKLISVDRSGMLREF